MLPTRVGHAVHLKGKAKDWIIKHKVPIEACLTSAVACSMVKSFDEHPALELYKNDHPVAFFADDSAIFGSLPKELAIASIILGLEGDQLSNLNDAAYSMMFKGANNKTLKEEDI